MYYNYQSSSEGDIFTTSNGPVITIDPLPSPNSQSEPETTLTTTGSATALCSTDISQFLTLI